MVLWTFTASWSAPLFMILFGITTGLYGIASTAIWPKLYGTSHLGSIKAFVQSVMVLASGLSPALFGRQIDRGIPLEQVALACCFCCRAPGHGYQPPSTQPRSKTRYEPACGWATAAPRKTAAIAM
jgi:hypothetical protein